MSIDDRLLPGLTDEVGQSHHEDTGPSRNEYSQDRPAQVAAGQGTSRRSLLAKAGASGALLTLGALAAPTSGFLPAAFAASPTDNSIIMFDASFEFAVVAAYQAMLDSGKLSASATRTVTNFQSHHRGHGRALNEVTLETTEKPNAKLLASLQPKVKAAADEKALLEIASTIEEELAATYLSNLGVLQDKANAGVVASILPVESQHAVVIGQLLKKQVTEYMPSFQNDKQAVDPSAYPV